MQTPDSTARQHLGGSASKLVEQEEQRQDLGFGTKLNDSYERLINKDGSFNVNRQHESFWDWLNLYNRLITMGWLAFLGWVGLAYVVANVFFAGVYLLAGADSLKAADDATFFTPFWKAFFFSAQTLTTVGYGHIAPNGFLTSAIAAFESMMGLLAFALATGLLYGRFSRPGAHIRFSRRAVFAPYLDVNGWMFRIINARANQLIDIQVEVSMSRREARPDGTFYRRYYGLALERNKVTFFPTSWTIVHPITADSPLHGCTPADLEKTEAEFMIMLRAMDDTFSQAVHARYSYRYDEVLWGRKFRPMFDSGQQRIVTLDLNKLDDTDPVSLQ